jgi:hypothetical protein
MSDNTRTRASRGRDGNRLREFVFLTDEHDEVDGVTAGGARRNRTDDLLLAKQALSQLSYGPASHGTQQSGKWWAWEDLNFRPHAYQARALTS